MGFLPWVPTVGSSTVPLGIAQGGTGTTSGASLPQWMPSDDGFLGANSNPEAASGGGTLVATNAYLARLPVRTPTLISNLWVCVSTIGAGTANGFSGCYIVSGATGTVLAQSNDQTATFTGTTGWKQIAMTSPVTVGGGAFPYAVIMSNLLTTQVSLLRQNNSANDSPQATASPSTLRWAQQAGFGSAVAAVTLSSNVVSAFSNIVLWS